VKIQVKVHCTVTARVLAL